MPDFGASPINYNIDVASPFQSAMQGYQAGAAIRQDQQAQVQQQQQQAAQQQQAQILSALASNPQSTADDYARVMTAMPQLAAPLTKAWETKNDAQQQTHVANLLQYGAAIKNGAPEVAADSMNAQADAMEKAAGGPTRDSQALRTQAQVVVAHPQFAYGMIAAQLAANPKAKDAAATLSALGTEQRAEDMAPSMLSKSRADATTAQAQSTIKGVEAAVAPVKAMTDIANVQSQIAQRSNQYGLDRDKLTTETQLALKKMGTEYGQLPEDVRKNVDTDVTESIASQQSADKMLDLATRLEAEGGGYGALSTAGEWIKKATGNQNEMTRLRAEYNRIVTPAAMAAYKKVASGSTSDKDIDTAMTGVPKDTADAATMTSFLRGAAKLQTYSAVLANAQSEWRGANRSLGKAASDLTIDGVQVPAGTTFKSFTEQYVGRKIGEKLNAPVIKAAPYGVWATPGQ